MKYSLPAILKWAVLACFLLAGVMSSGFHQYDEHFQIIEFARYAVDGNYTADLPWEYQARIRPAIQPLIAAGILKSTPFLTAWHQAMLIRCLMALLVFFALRTFLKSWLSEHPQNALWYTAAAGLFYLIPYLSARYSAEVFGAVFTLLALSAATGNSRYRWLLAGLFFAMAVSARLQLVFFLGGFGLWLFLVKRPGTRAIMAMAAGFAGGLAANICIDRLFYGEWCLTAWNYFHVNVLQNKSAEYGTHAWSYYFTLPLKMGLLSVLNGLAMASAIWFFIRRPGHYLTWSVVPFILGHMVVAHKEMRFLFPVVFILPYFMVWAAADVLKKRHAWLLTALAIINLPVMTWKCITPADGQPLLYHRLEQAGVTGRVYATHGGIDLIQAQAGLRMPFYQKDLKIVLLDSWMLDSTEQGAWLCMWPGQGVPASFVKMGQVLPEPLERLRAAGNIPVTNARWQIFRKKP